MKKLLLSVAIGAGCSSAYAAEAMPSMEEMWKIIQQQQAEIQRLKSQVSTAETKVEEIDLKVEATASAVEQGVAPAGSEKLAKLAAWAEKTSIGGYGEHHFNHFEDGNDQIDAHRYVLFVGHQFTDNLRFFSEIELEHSLSGEGKPGEVELEQAYIEYDFAEKHSVQVGQFLLPIGIMNETHEPDTFYGTERNKVEAEVIPATWWEAGVMAKGEIAPGLSYNAAVHSGLKTTNYRIRSGRQKNAEANAEDLAFTGRLKYTGIQGLELAASVQYQQDITQGSQLDTNDDDVLDFTFDNASAVLLESHLIYQAGDFGFRALWAEWDIDGVDFEAANADTLSGWYVEPSYKITDQLGLFVRYSEWDRGDKMLSNVDYEAYDFGINYWIHPQVVLKADYTDTVGEGDEADALNLGVGWSF